MNHAPTATKGKNLLALSVTCFAGAVVWLFYASDKFAVPYLKANWVRWFKVDWFEDSEARMLPIFFTIGFGPTIVLGTLALWFFACFYQQNFASIHQANLKELGKAKSALQQSLVSVEAIEREYKGKLESYEKLQEQLRDLQAMKQIDTEDLRRKLNAIATASRASVWFERVLGFLIGVVSSLCATYVWEKLR